MHCRTFGLDTIFAFDGAAAFTPDALAKLPKVLGKAEEETAGTDAELVAASPKDEHSSKTAPPKRTYGSITEALAAGE
jgi:hypothetical protein